MGLEFYILNHVLYLIISPPIDNGPGGALEAKANQRQPLWRAATMRSHCRGQQCCCGGTATGPKGEGGYARCHGPCVAAS